MTGMRSLIALVEGMTLHPFLQPRLVEDAPAGNPEAEAAKLLCDDILSGNSEGALYMLKFELGRGEDDAEPFDEGEVLDWCENRVADAAWEIESRIKGGIIRCWRVITAPADWQPQEGQHPGIYWSWDQDAAEAHWGSYRDDHVVWEITADIPESSIDKVMTLVMNAHPDYEEEREVRIFKDAPVEIVGVRRL